MVNVIKSMYAGATTAVKVKGGESSLKLRLVSTNDHAVLLKSIAVLTFTPVHHHYWSRLNHSPTYRSFEMRLSL
jgi:hypothetical protein